MVFKMMTWGHTLIINVMNNGQNWKVLFSKIDMLACLKHMGEQGTEECRGRVGAGAQSAMSLLV